jgi:hypothetical protein
MDQSQPNRQDVVTHDSITLSLATRFRGALILAIVADVTQAIFFPLFIEGAESPADDVLDVGVGAAMVFLLGWHWEFLPSFLAKLVPGVDMVPFWTLAVANVYRKSKADAGPHTRSEARTRRIRPPRNLTALRNDKGKCVE